MNLDEISIDKFYMMLSEIYKSFYSHYWIQTFTTEFGVNNLALLILNVDNKKTVKAALQLLNNGHLRFKTFDSSEKETFIIPFYNISEATKAYIKITN